MGMADAVRCVRGASEGWVIGGRVIGGLGSSRGYRRRGAVSGVLGGVRKPWELGAGFTWEESPGGH